MNNKRRKVGGSGRPRLMSEFLSSAGSTAAASSSSSHTSQIAQPRVSPQPNPSSSHTSQLSQPTVSPEPNPSSSQTPRLALPTVSPQPEHTVAAALSSPNSRMDCNYHSYLFLILYILLVF